MVLFEIQTILAFDFFMLFFCGYQFPAVAALFHSATSSGTWHPLYFIFCLCRLRKCMHSFAGHPMICTWPCRCSATYKYARLYMGFLYMGGMRR